MAILPPPPPPPPGITFPISVYKVGNTTFVKVTKNVLTDVLEVLLLVSTTKNRTLIPYKNGVKILPDPTEKVLNNFYIDYASLVNNYGAVNGADLINKFAEEGFFKTEAGKGIDTWKAKTYLDNPTLVEYNNKIYKLKTATPFVSTDIAAEITANDWALIADYAAIVLNNNHRTGDGTDHAQVATNKTNADASKVKTDLITVTSPKNLDSMKSEIDAISNGQGLTYNTLAAAMAYVDPVTLVTPVDNTPFLVQNLPASSDDGKYKYLASEVGGYLKIGNITDYTTDNTLFIDSDKIIKSNVSRFTEKIIWHTGDSTSINLAFTPTDILNIFINGTKLYDATQYTITLPNIINILSALADGDVITIQYEHLIN